MLGTLVWEFKLTSLAARLFWTSPRVPAPIKLGVEEGKYLFVVLEEGHTTAAFFCSGPSQRNKRFVHVIPSVAGTMSLAVLQERHIIGNHRKSFSHVALLKV